MTMARVELAFARRSALVPALVCAALLAACSPQAAERSAAPTAPSASVHPASGLEVIPLTIVSKGRTHAFRVEVARTLEQQARGLMFRTAMGADEGMLFPYDQPRGLSFWMKNTVLSLDLIFIGEDRRIINIAPRATPYSEQAILSDAPGIAVLELNGGRAEELGLAAGDQVEW
jgi:uncharacterized membrane protein (UPF0127 family)